METNKAFIEIHQKPRKGDFKNGEVRIVSSVSLYCVFIFILYTCRILTQCLELINKQYQLLEATNSSTPLIHDLYDNVVKQIEGDKEVGWFDQNAAANDDNDFHDISVSSFAPTHQALMDTIIAHSSPFRKSGHLNGNSRYSSPINAASLGLLTVSNGSNGNGLTPHFQVTPPKSPSLLVSRSSPHPLTNRMVATSDQKNVSQQCSKESDDEMAAAVKVSHLPKSPKLATGNQTTSSTLLSPEFKSSEGELIYGGGNGSPSHNISNSKVSPNLQCVIRKEWNRSNSPVTSPRLKKKRVAFNSPPPAIQEEEEIDSSGETHKVHKQPLKQSKPTPPSPPPRKEDIQSTKESLLAFTKLKEEQKRKETKSKPESPRRKDKDKVRSSFSSPKHSPSPSPKSRRINLAQLTSINSQTNHSNDIDGMPEPHAVAVVKPHCIATTNFRTPVTNTFDDNFVSSYPACSKSKLNHTPLGKSASIDNPTYDTRGSQISSLPVPYRQSPTLMSHPSPFRPLPNQHPAFPPPLPQRGVFNSAVPLSPISQQNTPIKPAFLPVSKTKTSQRMASGSYRSPVNIPIQPLPTLPLPPIPSPSTLNRTRTAGYNSSTSDSSSTQGFVLHPALPTPAVSNTTNTTANSKTTKSHRYSLTSPTQSRENLFASPKENAGSKNSDELNTTFTVTKTSKETRKYAVLEPMIEQRLPPSTHRESNKQHSLKKSSNHAVTTKPLAILQVGLSDSATDTGSSSSAASGTKKQPNYLTLTKSAASKKVQRTGHHHVK